MSQLGHYQLGYIETLSHWNQSMKESIDELVDNINHMCYLGLKDLLKDHSPYR